MNKALNNKKYRIISCFLTALSCLLILTINVTANATEAKNRHVHISTSHQLNDSIRHLTDNTTLEMAPGVYSLLSTLKITRNNIHIIGTGDNEQDVVLQGPGMDNANFNGTPSGIWSTARNLKVENLTIRDMYQHGIILQGRAQSPSIKNVAFINIGEQAIKANPIAYGTGVNNGLVENCLFLYTDGPAKTNHGGGTGYTNAVDVHGGENWIIRGNRFANYHTPDSANHLWNPAVLMWNGSANTTVEDNIFINVDRAIALGLTPRKTGTDHSGGVVSGNIIYYPPNFYSTLRKSQSDAAIIIWDSPNTTVSNNTVITNGNLHKSIEFRFNTSGSTASNNRVDAPIYGRESAPFTAENNYSVTDPRIIQEILQRITLP